jgi:imidazolonepropionase-like amidohydrolase
MIKVHREDFRAKRKRHFTVEEMRPAVERVTAAGLSVGATAPDTFALRRALEAGIRIFGSGRALVDDVTLPEDLGRAGAFISPNLAGWARNTRWATPENVAKHRLSARRCHEAGVTLVTGTTYYGDNLVDEIIALREYIGMSPMASLQAATASGARILGHADEFGTVETGKRADLLVVAGDPLADPAALRTPERVVRAGRVFDPSALRQAIAPLVDIRGA